MTVVREGQPTVPVTSLVARPVLDVDATRLVLGPRELRAALYLPSWHRPGDRLPVLLDPYGGAARQQVTAGLDWRMLTAQWFAEQGFAVLAADGAGTPGRGPAWERESYGDLLSPVLDDQVTALHEAARRFPDLDLARVGIRGWSFGGCLATFAVLRRRTSSTPPSPARASPISCCTTPIGANASSATPPTSPRGTKRCRWCAPHRR